MVMLQDLDGAVREIIKDDGDHIDFFSHRRLDVLHDHREVTVSDQAEDLAVRKGQLRSQRSGKREPNSAKTDRSQRASRRVDEGLLAHEVGVTSSPDGYDGIARNRLVYILQQPTGADRDSVQVHVEQTLSFRQ